MQDSRAATAVMQGSGLAISRWSVPFAGFLITLMGGISYAWGVFVVPLTETYGWSRAEAMLPLSVYLLTFSLAGMVFGGMLQDRLGPRMVSTIGGALFLVAYLMAMQISRVPHVWWLVVSYGLIGGLGCGLAYSAAVPTARKWFPDKTALAVAIAVTGFGLAATVFAPWITRLIETVGIEGAFLTLGLVTSAVTLLAAWLMRLPAEGWAPPASACEAASAKASASTSMFAPRTEATLGEALKTPLFYAIWIGFFGVIFGGLMAMAHVVPYGVSVLGMEKSHAALAAVFFGLANGFGRPVAGFIAEKVGPVALMLVTYVITGATFLLFNTVATTPSALFACAFIFGWGFAVTLGLFPTLTTIAFGIRNLGAVYGGIFTAFGAAAFFGPMAAAWAYDVLQSYVLPFALAGALALAGWCICLFLYKFKFRLP